MVGAGISVEKPSSIPNAREIIESIIRKYVPDKEIKTILSLNNLRFEHLIEMFKERIDKSLNIFSYFDLDIPCNDIHLFLADCCLKGHTVITTNFDYQIERALAFLSSGNIMDEINFILTKNDYQTFVTNSKKNFFLKIHGSKKNFFTNKQTEGSLVTTIRSLGLNKNSENSFMLETYKQKIFDQLIDSKTLIVIGYSGSDDFDISPTLKSIRNIKKLIWINHSNEESNKIYEVFGSDDEADLENLTNIQKMLIEISDLNDFEVYYINTQTNSYIKKEIAPKILSKMSNYQNYFQKQEKLSQSFQLWIDSLPEVDLYKKYLFAAIIYNSLHINDELIKICNEALKIASYSNQRLEISNLLALGYQYKGEYQKSAEILKKCIEEYGDNREDSFITSLKGNLASSYFSLGKIEEAMKISLEGFENVELIGDVSSMAYNYADRCILLLKLKKYKEANILIESALKHVDRHGILNVKSILLRKKSEILKHFGKNTEALDYANKGLKISESLGIPNEISKSYYEISDIYLKLGDFENAIENINKSIEIDKNSYNPISLASDYVRRGQIHLYFSDDENALLNYKKALEIKNIEKDSKEKSRIISEIGNIYYRNNNFTKAKSYAEKALQLISGTEFKSLHHTYLKRMALILVELGEYDEGKKKLELALEICKKYKFDGDIANVYESFSILNYKHKNYVLAKKYCLSALKIYENPIYFKNNELFNISTLYLNLGAIEQHLGNIDGCVEYCKKAVDIASNLNNAKLWMKQMGLAISTIVVSNRMSDIHEIINKTKLLVEESLLKNAKIEYYNMMKLLGAEQ